ncbi:MAG: DeoR/GlpR family DNA-binding transcription regulator [Bryobacteraceae bacterium]
MKATGRQLRIRQLLEGQEFVDLETLCRELEASDSSVRRDLINLEQEGILKRVYGGAMAMQAGDHALDFDWQSTRMAEEKRRIGALAAGLIENGQTVILDGGSTVAAVARLLTSRSLHVITNSLPIAEIFNESRQIEVTLTGGYLFPRLRVTLGPLCEQMLAGVNADVLIMGIGGATAEGFSNTNTLVVSPQRKMIEVSQKVVIVADHAKFGRRAVMHLAPLDVADVVVSDSGLPAEFQEMLREREVQVLLA